MSILIDELKSMLPSYGVRGKHKVAKAVVKCAMQDPGTSKRVDRYKHRDSGTIRETVMQQSTAFAIVEAAQARIAAADAP